MLITFSTGTTGLTPGYKILEADKSEYAARATAGITDLGGGEYGVEVANATLAGRVVMWDTGETVPRYATEMFAFTSEALDVAAILALVTTTSAGRGAITWTYTLTEADTTPIPDAEVWITTDEAGSEVVASGRTNASGVVTFYLDDGSTVYVWSQKTGVNFPDMPDTEVVS